MKDMKVKDIVMKVIDVLYNIIVGSLTIVGKVIVFLIALAQSGSVDKSKSSVNFIFSEVKSDDVVEDSPKVDVEFEIVAGKRKMPKACKEYIYKCTIINVVE
jgi:hypothetical protein